jgi:hypothetical protein
MWLLAGGYYIAAINGSVVCAATVEADQNAAIIV